MTVVLVALLVLVWFSAPALWVYRDASRRDWSVSDSVARSPLVWAVAVWLLALVALPRYLRRRRQVPLRFEPAADPGASSLRTDPAADWADLNRWDDED